MRPASTLLLGSTLALVAAAPAAAADVEVKGLDTLVWDKPEVTVTAGDTVRWTFAGTQQPHNVASSSPNWQYRTAFGAPAPPGSYTFSTPGIYNFVCEVHATTMIGRVTVTDASGNPPDPPDPPGPGDTPFTNDTGPLVVVESGGRDRTRPRLRGLRVKGVRGGGRVRFRVNERARVYVRVTKRGITLKRRSVRAAGRGSLTVRGLRAGRYRVVVRAVDPAGNRSRARARWVRFR